MGLPGFPRDSEWLRLRDRRADAGCGNHLEFALFPALKELQIDHMLVLGQVCRDGPPRLPSVMAIAQQVRDGLLRLLCTPLYSHQVCPPFHSPGSLHAYFWRSL